MISRKQQDFRFEFLGLTVFYDPKKGIKEVFSIFMMQVLR
jgi:hypothetical protein